MQLATKADTNNLQKLIETVHLHKNILLLIHAGIKKIMKRNACERTIC